MIENVLRFAQLISFSTKQYIHQYIHLLVCGDRFGNVPKNHLYRDRFGNVAKNHLHISLLCILFSSLICDIPSLFSRFNFFSEWGKWSARTLKITNSDSSGAKDFKLFSEFRPLISFI